MAEQMASAKTSKAKVFSASADDDARVLGYMMDPKSIAAKTSKADIFSASADVNDILNTLTTI